MRPQALLLLALDGMGLRTNTALHSHPYNLDSSPVLISFFVPRLETAFA